MVLDVDGLAHGVHQHPQRAPAELVAQWIVRALGGREPPAERAVRLYLHTNTQTAVTVTTGGPTHRGHRDDQAQHTPPSP